MRHSGNHTGPIYGPFFLLRVDLLALFFLRFLTLWFGGLFLVITFSRFLESIEELIQIRSFLDSRLPYISLLVRLISSLVVFFLQN